MLSQMMVTSVSPCQGVLHSGRLLVTTRLKYLLIELLLNVRVMVTDKRMITVPHYPTQLTGIMKDLANSEV